MIHSDKIRRFEYSTTATSAAKSAQRTELQRDIDAWLAAGNKIQEAPPLVVQPRRCRPSPEAPEVAQQAAIKKRRFNSYSADEIAVVRTLKARGLTHQEVADALTDQFRVRRTRNSVEHLCIDHGIPSAFVRREPRAGKRSGGAA